MHVFSSVNVSPCCCTAVGAGLHCTWKWETLWESGKHLILREADMSKELTATRLQQSQNDTKNTERYKQLPACVCIMQANFVHRFSVGRIMLCIGPMLLCWGWSFKCERVGFTQQTHSNNAKRAVLMLCREKTVGGHLSLARSLTLHPPSSRKLIFTLMASDYALLYKKVPYQTSSGKMELVSAKGFGRSHVRSL